MSPLVSHLVEYLHEDAAPGQLANPATVLSQGERAQRWLLETYLGTWLDTIGGLPGCDYPRARSVGIAVRLRQLGREKEQLGIPRTNTEAVFYLESLHHFLRRACADINHVDERAMQWGVWARDVAMSVVCGFAETGLLDPVVCESAVPCCMYAGCLVSMVVEDQGTAEEIEERMFEGLPRELLGLLKGTPAAPEA